MRDLQTILTRCDELAVQLILQPNGRIKIQAPAPLPSDLRHDLAQHKGEIRELLEANTWLQTQLITPQRIAPLIHLWIGPLDRPTGHTVTTLMEAKRRLQIRAYVGPDEKWWWQAACAQSSMSEENQITSQSNESRLGAA
ncbi:MAG: hypothetical protein AB7G75_36105 [Candidatus Binatia bacterium]